MTSLRRMLLVPLIGVMALVMMAAAGFSYHVGLQEADELFDAKLAHSSRVLMSLVDGALDSRPGGGRAEPVLIRVWHGQVEGTGAALALPDGHAYETKLAFQVRDAQGRVLVRSDSGPREPLAPLQSGFHDVTLDGLQWRTFSLRSDTGNWYQSGELADIRSEIAEEIAWGTLLPLLLALPLLLLATWLVVRNVTASLQRISAEIGQRDPDHMAAIQLQRVPGEIQGLVGAVNHLLERLQASLQRERRFTADAAHELRTPLAALKVHADNLRHARDADERMQSHAYMDTGIARMERLVSQLLALSRLEPKAMPIEHAPVDMAMLVRQQVQAQAAVAKARDIGLAMDVPEHAVALDGNDMALDMLVRNLLDNALRYTPRNGCVCIALQPAAGGVELCVEDSGPGIPSEARQRVFERFHRELGNGTDGSGLGLAIAHQAVLLHQGTIALDASRLGGLRVTVWLPAGQATQAHDPTEPPP